MASVEHERTIGNRIWIGLLAFSLLVMCALDCVVIYLIAIRSAPLRGLLWLFFYLYLTWTVYRALRRRIFISGSDSFFS
jgi:hypothetical protein